MVIAIALSTKKTKTSTNPALPGKITTTERPKSLHELFESDFANLPRKKNHFQFRLLSEPEHVRHAVEARVCLDFDSNSSFLCYYIPPSEDSLTAIKFIAENPKAGYKSNSGTETLMFGPGLSTTQESKLTFTGRIFIYVEDIIPDRELNKLKELFDGKGLAVEFRDMRYVVDMARNSASRIAAKAETELHIATSDDKQELLYQGWGWIKENKLIAIIAALIAGSVAIVVNFAKFLDSIDKIYNLALKWFAKKPLPEKSLPHLPALPHNDVSHPIKPNHSSSPESEKGKQV